MQASATPIYSRGHHDSTQHPGQQIALIDKHAIGMSLEVAAVAVEPDEYSYRTVFRETMPKLYFMRQRGMGRTSGDFVALDTTIIGRRRKTPPRRHPWQAKVMVAGRPTTHRSVGDTPIQTVWRNIAALAFQYSGYRRAL
ncbi:hypothetical protein LMG28614_02232 [Paraburkholderia ultramafica]|uniref:Uncharacterized protein n=1 Tax=Paraburkholderia ultramafica TaxID=1544867 RepID=A0A6S7B2Q5_9BURK|nr:hypothetical protein [Paraburkholderia ultramafica]CAB3785898.1 hypothetical protein LMG28614_02232 [Paraburkholderia ultramafica]